MNTDFVMWLKERELTMEIKMLWALSPITGVSFWSVFKNTAQ